MFKNRRQLVGLAGLASVLLVLTSCGGGVDIAMEALPETEPSAAEAPARVWTPDVVAAPEPGTDAIASVTQGDGIEILPPVIMGADPEAAPAAPPVTPPQVAAPKVTAPAAPAPATPAIPAPKPAVEAPGFPSFRLQLNTNPANQALVDKYSAGINTCGTMLEKILVRDPSAGAANHSIALSVENLNPNANGNLRVAGVATTPTAASYDAARQNQLALTLDTALRNQYNVCTTLVHETLHTLSVVHVGSGLMAPTIQDMTYLDKPVSDGLKQVGYQFVPAIQNQLDGNQRVLLADVVENYTDSSKAALASQAA